MLVLSVIVPDSWQEGSQQELMSCIFEQDNGPVSRPLIKKFWINLKKRRLLETQRSFLREDEDMNPTAYEDIASLSLRG